MRLIAFSGKKGAGKDWCSGYLHLKKIYEEGQIVTFGIEDDGQFWIKSWFDFKKAPFFFEYEKPLTSYFLDNIKHAIRRFSSGDILKKQMVEIFGFPRNKLWGNPYDKEEKCGLYWRQIPHHNGQIRREDIAELTYREAMQAWAELVRYTDNLAWIRANCNRILQHFSSFKDCIAINTDIRYVDEVEYLRKWSKENNIPIQIVRLTRKHQDDPHISETNLDDFDGFDLIIDNANMSFKEVAKELDARVYKAKR